MAVWKNVELFRADGKTILGKAAEAELLTPNQRGWRYEIRNFKWSDGVDFLNLLEKNVVLKGSLPRMVGGKAKGTQAVSENLKLSGVKGGATLHLSPR